MGEFAELEARFKNQWGREFTPFTLRLRRATSWGLRGEQQEETGDVDSAFVFFWIAFNALYAEDAADYSERNEQAALQRYVSKVDFLDKQSERPRVYRTLQWHVNDVRDLLNNEYVFKDFWKHQNGVPGFERWQQRFEREKEESSFTTRDVGNVLRKLFERLYVLRNQMVHGGATWGGKVNRAQVTVGARLMKLLLPTFITLMLDNPDYGWGKPYYPVVNQPDDGA